MRTTSQLIIDTEEKKIEGANRDYRESLSAHKEYVALSKTNNKDIKYGDAVETAGFGVCTVSNVDGEMITIEINDGSKRTLMNNPKFIWRS